MRIDSGTIGMESARSYKSSNMTVRRFRITEYQAELTQEQAAQNDDALNATVSGEEENTQEQTGQTTKQSATTLQEWQNRFGISTTQISLRRTDNDTANDIRQQTIRYIFNLLFGDRKSRMKDWIEENVESSSSNSMQSQQGGNLIYNVQTSGNGTAKNNQISSGSQESLLQNRNVLTVQMRSLDYTLENWQTESEETSFSTVGTVRTKDGREISFNVNVGMSREFQQYYKEDLHLGSFKMCDPLVINLDTDVAELSDQNFYFDIDADGEKDEIAQLSGGSGYLALDKNEDGVINDGSELFGTASGNGFADLAEYDEDGNGWIDEGDAIWSKLKIWCKDENGNDMLYRLADKGVGAICLQNAATDFTLKSDDGHTKGAIRNTGIFLYENGNVGTIQHVDVAKYQSQA